MEKDYLINKIKQIMSHRKINQTKLAEKAGLTNKTVGRWIKGEIPPSENSLKKIATAHNVSLRWLCDENYNGPMNADAEWAYDAAQIKFTLQESAQLYERIQEIIAARGLNPAKLVALSGITVTMEKEPYFLGSPPRPRDIEKISRVTGYNKDWIWYGHPPRLDSKPFQSAQIQSQVAQPKYEYDKHGGWTPQTTETDWGYLSKVVKIIDSDTVYSKVLLQNIDAFYQAVMAEKDNHNGEKEKKSASGE